MKNSDYYDSGNNGKSQGKFPGRIKGIVFEKTVKTENFLRYLQGYALAEEQLLLAKSLGVREVRLHEKSTRHTFCLELDYILSHGKKIHHPPYEPQLCVLLKQWRRLGDCNQTELFGGA